MEKISLTDNIKVVTVSQDEKVGVFDIVENSWPTPLILTLVTAAPGIEESKTRRRALPIVKP
jgi:hypothetical protein